METIKTKQDTTLRELLELVMADIDIFLLQEENQKNDKEKLYTKEEIRNQLKVTLEKITNLPSIGRGIFDVPLFSTLAEKVLENSGFSKSEIKRYKNSL